MDESPLRFIIKNLMNHKIRLAIAFFWSTLFVFVSMQVPILTGALIDGMNGVEVKLYGLIVLQSTPAQTVNFVALALVINAALSGISIHFRNTSMAKVSRRFVAELRMATVRKLESLSLDIHAKHGPGELLNRVILDAQSLRSFVSVVIISNITNIFRMIYPLAIVFLMDPYLSLLAGTILPAQLLVTRHIRRNLHEASEQAREYVAGLTTVTKEHLDAIETIQTSNAEQHSVEKINGFVEDVEKEQVKAQKYIGLLQALVTGLSALGLALVWWMGGLKVLAGTMTIGTLVAFTGLWFFIYSPLSSIYFSLQDYQTGIVAAKRIQQILSTPSSIPEYPDAKKLEVPSAKIEFRDVRFSYPTAHGQLEVLTDVNLSIGPKGLIGIVGRSGAGKSTILKLITRLYDPSEGQILIDGQDIKRVTLETLRSQIAVVPQTPMIFTGSIAENILLVKPDATQAEVEEACRSADALEFIFALDMGFDTRLGQGGANLSGGETQRIAIARALIRKPKILLLDEPASALDSESEAAIMATLDHLKNDMTIIVVGHHLKAISKADRLIVVDNGQVAEEGTHKELVASSGVYSMLYLEDSVRTLSSPANQLQVDEIPTLQTRRHELNSNIDKPTNGGFEKELRTPRYMQTTNVRIDYKNDPPASQQPTSKKALYCSICYRDVDSQANFCDLCGSRLKKLAD